MSEIPPFINAKKGSAEAPARPPGPPALPPKAQRLAEILLARAHQGQCVISQAELCRLTGWSRMTVWHYLNVLREQGIIEWEGRAERGKRLPNLYRIGNVNWSGRDGMNPELAALVARGQNVLILGPAGIGKSHQLSLLSQDGLAQGKAVLVLPRGTVRMVLVGLVDQLAQHGHIAEEELSSPLSRLSIPELGNLALSAMARARDSFLVLMDDLDQQPPSLRAFISKLMGLYNVQVVAAAKEEEKVQEFVDHFVVYQLPPLSREETERWVETFLGSRGIPVLGGERGRRRLAQLIWRRTGGNPRKIQALLRKIEAQGYVDRRLLREELHVGGRLQFADMTWLIIATAALVMAIRYLGLGLHDRTLYLLGGLGYASLLLVRWFSYRWRRK